MKFQDHILTLEDKLFLKEYIEDIVQDLQEIYHVNQIEAHKIVRGSSFLATMERDPEYVINYDTEYWAEKLYTRRRIHQYQ